VPLALTTVRSQSAAFAGLALTVATISWTTSAWLQARLVMRHSRRALVIVGLLLVTSGIIGTIVVLQPGVPIWVTLLTWGSAGFGMGFVSPTLALLMLELAPAGQEGASTSAGQLAGVLGIAIGTGIGGAIVGNTSAGVNISPTSIAAHGLLMVVMVIIAVWVARRLPGRSKTTTN
jgi:MFS family permease